MSHSATNPDHAETSPVTPSQLKKFLTESPLIYKTKLHRGAEKHILTNCYRSLWGNDLELMKKYFFKEGLSDSDNLSQLLEKYNLFGASREDHTEELMEGNEEEPEYWESQRGKQCGHLFKKGESVYRCRNCGLDDTCVMCSKCFHATNHDGHDVKIWISKGAGGCCDCGDPEAWKIPLKCQIHSASPDIVDANSTARQLEPLSSVPQNVMDNIRQTITVVIDYILETFATSPEEVVSSPRDVGSAVTVESIEQDCIDSHGALGLPIDPENQTYACVLWNDEKHSFDVVINILIEAIGCTKEEAAHSAECVDLYGRHVIKESKNIAELVQIARTISSIQLAVTICSIQKTVREEIAGLLLDWLKELTGGRYKFFSQVDGGNCIIRDMICEVLSADWALSPELAAISTRSRRGRMPEDQDDDFDSEGGRGTDMDEDEDGEGILFDENDMDQINEDMLLDEADIDEFFNIVNEVEGDSDEDEFYENLGEEEDDDSNDDFEDADEAPAEISSEQNTNTESPPGQVRPMDTEHQSTEVVVTEPAVSPPSRRRASNAPINAPASSHAAEMLKRRRLSASSQPKHSKNHKSRDILDMDWNLDQWLEQMEKMETDERVIAQKLGIPYAVKDDDISATRHVNAILKKEFRRKLRIDYLLQFDLRLWKTARISIKDLLIGTFISNFDYRPVIGTRFARNYPELVDAFFFKDREPENSVSTLSVQLLTVPTVALLLVKDFKFFGIVCSILQNFFLTDSVHMILPENKGYAGSQVDCNARAIGRHRYAYTIFDLRYVMNAEPVRLEISKNPIYLRQFIDMMYQFQAMDPLQRQTDTHVEYESKSWVAAFNMTLQTSKLCRLLAGCFDSLQPSEITMQEASRNLCRSIYRVLKAISDWDPHLAPRREEENALPDTRIIIKGMSHQNFHQVSTPNAGTFEIVDYDVTKDPVSFHHPFHWLLSELFENVSLLHQNVLNELGWLGGFKQMVNDAFQNKEHDMFLMVLDYPIRTLVILSQISCGVWVRNGFAIRNMGHSYKDVNVRENTLDCDIYLLQVGFTVCDSDQILLTLIDRFQLTDWFRGKYDKKSIYDTSQKTYMVEDFLNLLIICATEHGYASGTSTEQRIRRNIIQFLGIGSKAYSELLKLIPESLNENESFETELNALANFKAPDGLSDKGLYELKPEYINEIDPYFWHYTRNQREEAYNVLKKRHNQLNPDNKLSDKEELLVTPKCNPIEVGPFRHLGKFLHSHTLVQILVYALWDAKFHKASKSDTILDEALYLGMLAVTDKNSTASELAAMNVKGKYRADILVDDYNTKNFIDHAISDEYSIQINEIEKTHATLLIVILRCLDDESLSHSHKRFRFILDKIDQYATGDAKDRIAEWKERKSRETKADNGNNGNAGMSEYERKKAAAKARQAAIMSQFANAQSKFMEKHSDLYKTEDDENIKDMYDSSNVMNTETASDDDMEIVRNCHFQSDTCIVCQEELDDTKLFGTLGLIQLSGIQRFADLDNKDILADVLETSNQPHPWAPSEDNRAPFVGFPVGAHRSGLDISSCGHMMHSECFDSYQQSVDNQLLGELGRMFPLSLTPASRFLCPLCKALGNVLVPVVWKGKKESYPGVMVPCTAYADLGKTMKETAAELRSKIDVIPGSFEENKPSKTIGTGVTICDEEKLKHIYNQLMKVVHSTITDRSFEPALDLFNSVEDLYDMYAYTITDFEIAQRGAEGTRARDLTVEHTGTFIDDVSSTSQTLLKILALTNTLIPKLMDTPWQSELRFTSERLALLSLSELIPGTQADVKFDNPRVMLLDDPFKALVHSSFSLSEYPAVEPHHLLRSIYVAELTKCVIGLVRYVLNGDKVLKDPKIIERLHALNTSQQQTVGAESLQQFTNYVLGLLSVPQDMIDGFFKVVHPGAFAALVRTFSLPFLRKSLLFMVVHHGFIPQSPADDMAEVGEYENILDILRLPSFESVFELEAFEQELISGWCSDYLKYSQALHDPHFEFGVNSFQKINLNLPTQFKMVKLPYRLDQLLDESSKRACRRCKSVPEHSAICLICGTFVCARHFCCTEGTKGECNIHMKTCGGEIGIYLMVKDCFLLLLHDNGGSIMNAPFLDSHGEADLFFKRGAPQFLNDMRYEQIRQMWLNQSIPAFVRRKMENAYSATVWEAF